MMHLRPYLQVLRVANLPTAAADVITGAVLVGAGVEHWPAIAALCAASCCLYSAGMALNDVFDAARDRRERPERPIPAGQVSRGAAAALGVGLLVLGTIATCMVGGRAAVVGPMLAATILTYDAGLKTTFLGPGVMGLCRGLNLALGGCVVATTTPALVYAAALLWLYVASVTLFARREHSISRRRELKAALLGMTGAIVGQTGLFWIADVDNGWYVIPSGMLAACVWLASGPAIATGEPAHVQAAVRQCIRLIIVFDAVLVLAVRGAEEALVVAGCLIPLAFLGRLSRAT